MCDVHPLVQHELLLLPPAACARRTGVWGCTSLSYIKPSFNYVCARPLDSVFLSACDRFYRIHFAIILMAEKPKVLFNMLHFFTVYLSWRDRC